MGAFDTQVGGSHYKSMKIQPTEFIIANNLDFCQGSIIKYACRFRNKNGREDLEKIIHYAKILIESEYPEKAETELIPNGSKVFYYIGDVTNPSRLNSHHIGEFGIVRCFDSYAPNVETVWAKRSEYAHYFVTFKSGATLRIPSYSLKVVEYDKKKIKERLVVRVKDNANSDFSYLIGKKGIIDETMSLGFPLKDKSFVVFDNHAGLHIPDEYLEVIGIT